MTDMSDDELDKDWKPNGRPQSTMARSFSAALNDVFKIDNSLADLDAAVEQKKRAVSSQTSELEALEARLKATEERLKQRQAMSGMPNRGAKTQSPRNRMPLGDTFAPPTQGAEGKNTTSSPSKESNQSKTPTRPTFTAPPIPGDLPPTPGASEGDPTDEAESGGRRISADYVFIDKDGDYPQPPSSHRPTPAS